MSYSISGIKVNGGFKEYQEISSYIQKSAIDTGILEIQKLIRLLILSRISIKDDNNKCRAHLIDVFFDIYGNNHNDFFTPKKDTHTLFDAFSLFLKEHFYSESVFYYFSGRKDYFLIKINNNEIRKKTHDLNYVTPYSFSTGTGYSSFEETTDSQEEREKMYSIVSDDWEDFTKNSYYITENAFEQPIFDKYDFFKNNLSLFINKTKLKDLFSDKDRELVKSVYLDKYLEIKSKNKVFDKSKDFLIFRREILNEDNLEENIFKLFDEDMKNMDSEITVETFFKEKF